ncbi:MAG: hypothetical protein ABL901_03315 [Hyphomicrobiaceae bacterium]
MATSAPADFNAVAARDNDLPSQIAWIPPAPYVAGITTDGVGDDCRVAGVSIMTPDIHYEWTDDVINDGLQFTLENFFAHMPLPRP